MTNNYIDEYTELSDCLEHQIIQICLKRKVIDSIAYNIFVTFSHPDLDEKRVTFERNSYYYSRGDTNDITVVTITFKNDEKKVYNVKTHLLLPKEPTLIHTVKKPFRYTLDKLNDIQVLFECCLRGD